MYENAFASQLKAFNELLAHRGSLKNTVYSVIVQKVLATFSTKMYMPLTSCIRKGKNCKVGILIVTWKNSQLDFRETVIKCF